jgi:2'-5' RNA ligase
MNIKPAKFDPGKKNWGSFALVTYLPDPLGGFLTELRRFLPGDNQAEAHITFLPPRDLSLPIEAASREIQQKLDFVKPFKVELGDVRVFPETNMLYLTVETGHKDLLNLHTLLNTGGLSAQEHFEFIPHLTLGGPLSSSELAAASQKAERAWKAAELSREFVVNEVVLLWQPGACSEKEWTRMSSYTLVEIPRTGTLAVTTGP